MLRLKLSYSEPFFLPGTTGLISWQGAQMLMSWAETFGTSFLANRRHILELGSGAGLFGLSVAASRWWGQGEDSSHSYTFTDCHPKVLNLLTVNVGLNFGKVRRKRRNKGTFFHYE